MRQFVDSTTGEKYYTEEVLRLTDEIVEVFRPVGRSYNSSRLKPAKRQSDGSESCHSKRLVF
ncbi:hypothetical protein [Brevibacillus sp. HB1.4B]|uniref:hypothetical protein n=1 Tax=Brevibacillus sp. HB1.4B TaxID=2738845 RepID=UPI001C2BF7EF|nr:hypothetical protein [Brevibacillus sp. HB1.4B]